MLAVEVADGEAERFADPKAGGDQEFEQAAVLLGVGARDHGLHLVEGEDSLGALVVEAGPLAALELAARVDRDRAATGSVGKNLRERPQRGQGGRAAQPFAAHGGDEVGDVVDADLVEAAAAEVGDQVLAQRPAVRLARALPDRLPFEPLPGVLLEALADRLDPVAAAAAQPQLGALRFGVVE